MPSYATARAGAIAAAKKHQQPALILKARSGPYVEEGDEYSSRRTDGTLKTWNDAERNGWEVVEIVEVPQ